MKHTIISFLSLFLLNGCDNEAQYNPQLPPETQTGANTFGCYVNGKLLIPRDGTGTYTGQDKGFSFLGGYPDGAYNEIDISDFKSEKTAKLLVHIQNLRQIGVANYVIDESNGMSNIDGLQHTYLHCRVFNEVTNTYQYYHSFNNSGIIKITRFDLANGIISGTFSCKVRNSINLADEIEITEGRFDFNGFTLPNTVFP